MIKPFIILLGLFLFSLTAHSQSDGAAIDFVRANCHRKVTRYTDSLSHETIHEMKREFDAQFKKGYFGVRGLKLTRTERSYVDYQLILMQHFAWKPGLFENSKFIARDTINNLFSNKDSVGRKYIPLEYEAIYGFSKPVFLRNHTICFFYQENYCGSMCGSGSFYIYVKVNDRWKAKYFIEGWIS